jgi:hypothetical protein
MSSPDLAGSLRAADTVEAAASALLGAVRELAAPLVEAGATLARGLVHLRGEDDTYRGLVVEEWRGTAERVAPSATLFRWIARARSPLALDVLTGRGSLLGRTAEGASEPFAVQMPYVAHDRAASVQQMAARHVTHVVAFPLITPQAELVGMLALELSWPLASGRAAIVGGAWVQGIELSCLATASLLAVLPRSQRKESGATDPLLPVVGAHMSAIVEALAVFAKQGETILLSGPTGTGKSRSSPAGATPDHPAPTAPSKCSTCSRSPPSTQMGELFGWRRGAFTGAIRDHDGFIARAERGTLFIDEIDKLSLEAQAALLHLLEERRYRVLGHGGRRLDADVRFIVGTNADLAEAVATGRFREDLYYRINVLPMELPPLRERADEIADWARYMLRRCHATRGAAPEKPPSATPPRPCSPAARGPATCASSTTSCAAPTRSRCSARGERGATTVGLEEVSRAMSLELGLLEDPRARASASPHRDALEALARAVVDVAIAKKRKGQAVSLATLEGLIGGALHEASERLGSPKNAYLLFGATTLVENRNHTKSYKRELEKWQELLALLEDDGAP